MRTELFTNCVDIVGTACRPFDGTKCYVSTGAVDTDHIDNSSVEIIDYSGKPSRANLEVDSGDVLFAKMQGTKKTLLIDKGLANHVYSTGFCAVRAKERVLNRRCLYHLLSSEAFLAQKDRNCSGATQKAITNSGLKKIIIKVPSIEEQDSIADQLDLISRMIEKRQKELDTFDELIKARFVEMFGDLKSNNMQWKVEEFNNFAIIDTNMIHDFKGYEEYPHIGIDSIEKETGKISGFRTVKEDGVVSGKYLFSPRHIIYSKIRPNLNKVALPDFDGVCSADAYPILPNADKCNREFLAYVMRSTFFLDYILAFSNRTNLPKVNKQQVKGFRCPIPPKHLQDEFKLFVQQVDKSKVA